VLASGCLAVAFGSCDAAAVFERFTETARQVVVLAQEEASALKHNYIGTEHILLGLLRVEKGLAARVLYGLDVTLEEARAQVRRVVGEGDTAATWGEIPFTPRAKTVLELALREALTLGHNYIGTEHILLGLVRENEGVAAEILRDFDVDAETVRMKILAVLGGAGTSRRYDVMTLEPPPELADEIETVRREKEEALEAQDFEKAAALRARERELVEEARGHESPFGEEAVTSPAAMFRSAGFGSRVTSVVAIVLATAAFLFGLLVGWLIWG
jgi:hypothetical protein